MNIRDMVKQTSEVISYTGNPGFDLSAVMEYGQIKKLNMTYPTWGPPDVKISLDINKEQFKRIVLAFDTLYEYLYGKE